MIQNTQPYPNPARQQQATIDRNFSCEPVASILGYFGQAPIERLLFYRWLAFAGRIRG